MPVFRVERNKGYTVMSNYHLRDKSLSLNTDGGKALIRFSFLSLTITGWSLFPWAVL